MQHGWDSSGPRTCPGRAMDREAGFRSVQRCPAQVGIPVNGMPGGHLVIATSLARTSAESSLTDAGNLVPAFARASLLRMRVSLARSHGAERRSATIKLSCRVARWSPTALALATIHPTALRNSPTCSAISFWPSPAAHRSRMRSRRSARRMLSVDCQCSFIARPKSYEYPASSCGRSGRRRSLSASTCRIAW